MGEVSLIDVSKRFALRIEGKRADGAGARSAELHRRATAKSSR